MPISSEVFSLLFLLFSLKRATCLAHPILLHSTAVTFWREIQMTNLLSLLLPSICSHFVVLRFKYHYFQICPSCERTSFTPVIKSRKNYSLIYIKRFPFYCFSSDFVRLHRYQYLFHLFVVDEQY
jgi:hypothetical protein